MVSSADSHQFTTPYPWQEANWALLEGLRQAQRLPHALMLCGPAEIGKSRFAWAMARKMLCAAPVSGTACGQCKPCQLVAAGSHPDLFIVEPEEPGKAIKVDLIRELGEFAAKTAQQGGWKLVLLSPAEAMNANAANAFLKTLEEPSSRTLLILVTHQPARILPTIRSRCRLLTFPTPNLAEVTPWLSQVAGECEDTDGLLQRASGRPLRALRLLQTDSLDQCLEFENRLSQIARGGHSPLKAAMDFAQLDAEEAIDWFQQVIWREIREQTLSEQQDKPLARRLFRFLDRLTAAKRRLLSSANPNRQLLWEELLLDWQVLFAS